MTGSTSTLQPLQNFLPSISSALRDLNLNSWYSMPVAGVPSSASLLPKINFTEPTQLPEHEQQISISQSPHENFIQIKRHKQENNDTFVHNEKITDLELLERKAALSLLMINSNKTRWSFKLDQDDETKNNIETGTQMNDVSESQDDIRDAGHKRLEICPLEKTHSVELLPSFAYHYTLPLPPLSPFAGNNVMPLTPLRHNNEGYSSSNSDSDNSVNGIKKRTRRSRLNDDLWMKHFDELKRFKALFGHCNVTQSCKEFKNLANWVHNQRKNQGRTLTKHRREKLLRLGFEFDRSYAAVAQNCGKKKKPEEENSPLQSINFNFQLSPISFTNCNQITL